MKTIFGIIVISISLYYLYKLYKDYETDRYLYLTKIKLSNECLLLLIDKLRNEDKKNGKI